MVLMPMTQDGKEYSGRRVFLSTLGTAAVAGLAGCSGGNGNGGNGNGGNGNGGNGNGGNGNGGNGNGGNGGGDSSDDDSSGDGGSQESVTITLGSTFESGHFINEMARSWADTIDEETDGRIEIIVEDMLGGEIEVLEQTEIGAIQGAMPGAMWMDLYAPQYFWLECPFLFEDWDQQVRAHEETEFGQTARELTIEEGNQRILSPPIYRGYRHLTANQEISHPDGLSGVTMRVPELEAWTQIWDAVGADVTTVPFDELYSALQTDVAQAQENPAASIIAMNMYEVQSHVTLTEHLVSTGWVTMNEEFWQGLSESDRELLESTLVDHVEESNNTVAEEESGMVESLESEHGMTIVETDKEPWLSRAEPVLEDLFESDWEGSVEEVRDI
jgi:TRAP-type C4-dicarboxylate transport system substrate-binding protein